VLSRVEADWSDFRVDLNVFVKALIVNTSPVPATVKEFYLNISYPDGRTMETGLVEDFSRWSQRTSATKGDGPFQTVHSQNYPLKHLAAKVTKEPLQRAVHADGWLCFVARETKETEFQQSTLTLTIIDSLGGKHKCQSTGPWSCSGPISKPDLGF